MNKHPIFSTTRNLEVIKDPFPHVVIEDVLPADLANALFKTIPKFLTVKDKLNCTAYKTDQAGNPPEGSKYLLRYNRLEQTGESSNIWKEFMESQFDKTNLEQWWHLFSEEMSSYHPKVYEQLNETSKWSYGLRNIDCAENHDFLLDAEIVYHAPAGVATQERGPHMKIRSKILEFHLMLRSPEDDIEGGDLELYRFKENCFITYEPQQQIKNKDSLIHVKSIPYKHNQVVAWLNSPRTITAYSQREPGVHPINYMAMVFQLPKPVFALPSYAGKKTVSL